MTGKEDQYRASAIRALCVITDVMKIEISLYPSLKHVSLPFSPLYPSLKHVSLPFSPLYLSLKHVSLPFSPLYLSFSPLYLSLKHVSLPFSHSLIVSSLSLFRVQWYKLLNDT